LTFWDWEWVVEHLDLFGSRLVQHLYLTALAVGIGLLISIPVAIYAHRHRRVYAPVTWVTGILYTIPSLALLSLLVPFTGLSVTSAEIALVSYTLLILIRNTVTGLAAVDPDVKEAARGMGYTEGELLWKVEVPLALPAILAGLRIATVTTIGLVTVTALIGLGGLGHIMYGGFRNLYQEIAILVAVALSVLLAVAADGAILGMQKLLSPWTRRSRAQAVTP
jgi:osmoprotectant transport system permease protein